MDFRNSPKAGEGVKLQPGRIKDSLSSCAFFDTWTIPACVDGARLCAYLRRASRPDGRRVSAEESPGSTEKRRRITSGGGDPRESATESRPPSGAPGGKGERVRQERTASMATWAAWQAPPGARPNRGDKGSSRIFSGSSPGLVARGGRKRPSQRNGRHAPQRCGALQNPAYRPAGFIFSQKSPARAPSGVPGRSGLSRAVRRRGRAACRPYPSPN